jgi:hypothetical protein
VILLTYFVFYQSVVPKFFAFGVGLAFMQLIFCKNERSQNGHKQNVKRPVLVIATGLVYSIIQPTF